MIFTPRSGWIRILDPSMMMFIAYRQLLLSYFTENKSENASMVGKKKKKRV